MCCRCCQFLCAFIAPPAAVLCHSGCTMDFVINFLLTCCGIIPGIVHALYIICREPEQGITVQTNVNRLSTTHLRHRRHQCTMPTSLKDTRLPAELEKE
ncbi:hypothetical protein GCK32_010185 [Trichostrongylus colubriformis]|uniref:Uncharacterized protein n=1 Tax=Trichostrongylus colubriformis TaxID=6319 RepID=A0AAN8FEB5_TRICO